MFDKNKSELLHSLFILKGLLGTEFSKDAKYALNIPEYILMKMVSDGNTNLAQIREYLAVFCSSYLHCLSGNKGSVSNWSI